VTVIGGWCVCVVGAGWPPFIWRTLNIPLKGLNPVTFKKINTHTEKCKHNTTHAATHPTLHTLLTLYFTLSHTSHLYTTRTGARERRRERASKQQREQVSMKEGLGFRVQESVERESKRTLFIFKINQLGVVNT
jgi:hypothetical protein